MTPSVRIDDLFYHSRFPKDFTLLFLPFYIPLGVVVMVIRIFFALQLYLVLFLVPKSWFVRRLLLRVSGALTGLIVTQEGLGTTEYKMVVANHISHIDCLAFESLLPCFMNAKKCHVPNLLRWILKYDEVKPGYKVPLLVFPEGSTTNGKIGLLKFSFSPFDKANEPFVLALITISRPYFVQIAPSVLGGNWWTDYLWLLFAPYTHLRIRFVQPPKREDGITNEDYSCVVQNFMASKLGLQATKFDAKEKVEYTKRYFHELDRQNRERNVSSHGNPIIHQAAVSLDSSDMKLESLATRVKQVLPQVPLTVIQKDLRKTKCIDTTISNILERRVPYTPESKMPKPVENKEPTTVNVVKSKAAATTFGKDSAERHLSFQERKKVFVEAARQKYIAKHNLAGM